MPRCFVFDTRLAARRAIAKLDERMRALFDLRGYTVTAEGIVGKRVSDQMDAPAALTRTWDVERQRLDGKWVVRHPEEYPLRFRTATDRDADLQTVVQDRLADPIEEETPEWWPPVVGDN